MEVEEQLMEPSLAELKNWYEKNQKQIMDDFFTFLRFRSISTDPACKSSCLQTADWLIRYLKGLGMETSLWTNPGLPVVFAQDLRAGPSRPTVLIYHHYDVQPVDPVDLWKSDPFEPVVREGKVYARGASDNKGQCFATITALKAFFMLAQEKKVNIKIVIEGEEECGGPGTAVTFKEKHKELKADYLLIVDFGLFNTKTPALTLGMRGIATFHIECQNSMQDLHSGEHGGVALNPNRALAQVLAKIWDDEGRVTIPHFYDDVLALTPEEKKAINFDFDEEEYFRHFGVKAFSNEEGCNKKEANWVRPTVEINGMWGGYTGAGFKTVIPSKSFAKISCRLVPDQDPDKIEKNLRDFLQKNMASGIQLHIEAHHGAKAFRTSLDTKIMKIVAKSQEEVFQKPSEYVLCGGSVPIVPQLAKAAGAEVVLMGCALPSDDIHAPNEHFHLECFKLDYLTMARVLANLSQ